jgi:hypothetical protein
LCNWAFEPRCVVCKLPREKVISLWQDIQNARVTKAICPDCYGRTKHKWTEFGWKIFAADQDL